MNKLLYLLLLMPVLAFGDLSWTGPTHNTDGSVLTDLAGYKIYYGNTAGGPYPTLIDINNPGITTYSLDSFSPGTYYFVATAYNTSGVESEYSNEATKTIIVEPNPPTNLVVDVSNLTAYILVQSRNNIALLPVGNVIAGTSCDSTQNVKGHYVVPVESVEFIAAVSPQVVVAKCV